MEKVSQLHAKHPKGTILADERACRGLPRISSAIRTVHLSETLSCEN